MSCPRRCADSGSDPTSDHPGVAQSEVDHDIVNVVSRQEHSEVGDERGVDRARGRSSVDDNPDPGRERRARGPMDSMNGLDVSRRERDGDPDRTGAGDIQYETGASRRDRRDLAEDATIQGASGSPFERAEHVDRAGGRYGSGIGVMLLASVASTTSGWRTDGDTDAVPPESRTSA